MRVFFKKYSVQSKIRYPLKLFFNEKIIHIHVYFWLNTCANAARKKSDVLAKYTEISVG